ncbi:MAG: hypothetical protein AAFU68_00435 [Pseudomonadota bacterium]
MRFAALIAILGCLCAGPASAGGQEPLASSPQAERAPVPRTPGKTRSASSRDSAYSDEWEATRGADLYARTPFIIDPHVEVFIAPDPRKERRHERRHKHGKR